MVISCGTNDGIYRELQEENGLPEAGGFTQEEMESLDQMLADYLSGDETALEGAPLSEREFAHMRDVYALFEVARAVRGVLLIVSLLLLGVGAWLSRGRCLTRMCLIGLAALVVPVAAFAIWAAVDFSAAFTFFHEVLFTNDLWQLDAQTDILLKLLPEQFFADIAAVIAVRAAAYMAAVPLALVGVRYGRKLV